MAEPGMYSWRNRAVRWSVLGLVALALVSLLVGFVWLPSVHADFSAQGIWASICRAAGVPTQWGGEGGGEGGTSAGPGVRSTGVVLELAMTRQGPSDALGRGATLAVQQCTMCHGAQGVSLAGTPNLAGQYREVINKQLIDYRTGDRRLNSIMEALASSLNDRDIEDLATYYASLPKPRAAPVQDIASVPALVKTGDPMRNIAPCASCHGGIDRKLGTPWIDGMPKQYLVNQLKAFASGSRRNDSHAQMRNMARRMTAKEIDETADFYARHEMAEAR